MYSPALLLILVVLGAVFLLWRTGRLAVLIKQRENRQSRREGHVTGRITNNLGTSKNRGGVLSYQVEDTVMSESVINTIFNIHTALERRSIIYGVGIRQKQRMKVRLMIHVIWKTTPRNRSGHRTCPRALFCFITVEDNGPTVRKSDNVIQMLC